MAESVHAYGPHNYTCGDMCAAATAVNVCGDRHSAAPTVRGFALGVRACEMRDVFDINEFIR